jgi:alkylresorcinol/alkylpyrone synthase
MPTLPRLLSLATAVPVHRIEQEDVKQFGRSIFAARGEELTRLMPVYDNAGIRTRYASRPLAWLAEEHGWRDRTDCYIDSALALLQQAAEDCLDKSGRTAAEVDGIVVVSTTGIATPSLDALLMDRMSFRPTVQRLPIFGFGCAGGVLGLARAAALAKAAPGEIWMVLVVELCCLTFRPNDRSKSNIIATALFGEGAAAGLIASTDKGGPALTAWGEHTWPDSLDVMGWRIEDDGMGVLFSRDIPALVRRQLGQEVDAFLHRHSLTRDTIDSWLFHPGGTKVLEALEDCLSLGPDALRHARATLRDYGNMSAATVLFVLARALAAGDSGRMFLGALGPGFTAGFLTMETA